MLLNTHRAARILCAVPVLLALLTACVAPAAPGSGGTSVPASPVPPTSVPPTAVPPPPASGKKGSFDWTLLTLNGAAPGAPATLRLIGEEISGNSGCNLYSGTIKLDEQDQIRIISMTQTEKACDELHGTLESTFMLILSDHPKLSMSGDQLTLASASGTLVFQRAPAPMAETLENTPWYLSQLTQQGQSIAVVPQAAPALELHDGQVSGNTGCNGYGGTYKLDGDTIKFSELMQTMMACDDPLMQQEQSLMALFSKPLKYALVDGNLILSSADGEIIFSSISPVARTTTSPALIGTTWTLTTFIFGEIASSTRLDTKLTLAFDGKQVSGSAGCNTYFGTYTLDGEKLSVGALGTTRMACAEDVMRQETDYLTALGAAQSITLEGDVLTVQMPNGALKFQAQP